MLFRQGTDRLLATPLFARGRLVGFLDLRDKAAKKPFENPDLDAARRIADQIVDLLGSRNLWGLAPIPLSAAETIPPRLNTPMPLAALAIPGALLAALTATRNVAEAQTIVSCAGMTSDANEALQKHVRGWLERANQPQLNVPMPRIVYPFGTHAEHITAARIGALVS